MSFELHITVMDGDATGDTIVLTSGVHRTAKIGRMPTAAVHLEHPSVSRIHAVIELGPTEAVLVDMGTTAGTLLGGEPIVRAPLAHGDQVQLGECTLLVGIGEPVAGRGQEPAPEMEHPSTDSVCNENESPDGEKRIAFDVPAEYAEVAIHDPNEVAPEYELSSRHARLEVRRLVAGELVRVEHLRLADSLVLGESPGSHIFVGEDSLPISLFPMIQREADETRIAWHEDFHGWISHDGEKKLLSEWAQSTLGQPLPGVSDSYSLGFGLASEAQIEVGGWTLELRYVPEIKAPPRGLWRLFDFAFANLVLFSLLAHLVFGVYLYRLPAPEAELNSQFFVEPDRFASLILSPPKVEEKEEKAPKQVEERKKRKQVPEVERELVVTEENQITHYEDARDRRKAELTKQFSALFHQGGKGGADSLLGEAAGIGGNLQGGLVAVIGTRGESSTQISMPTVGLSSSMIPGGKLTPAMADAGVKTQGRMGGGNSEYGANVKLKKREQRKAVSLSTPTIMGALAREVVERVIRENRNQIRYCYEVELQRQQNLAGRVVVTWVIAASGRVARVKIKDTSLGSARTEKCIMRRIKTWQFPRPAGGGVVTVNYPFIFRAG